MEPLSAPSSYSRSKERTARKFKTRCGFTLPFCGIHEGTMSTFYVDRSHVVVHIRFFLYYLHHLGLFPRSRGRAASSVWSSIRLSTYRSNPRVSRRCCLHQVGDLVQTHPVDCSGWALISFDSRTPFLLSHLLRPESSRLWRALWMVEVGTRTSNQLQH